MQEFTRQPAGARGVQCDPPCRWHWLPYNRLHDGRQTVKPVTCDCLGHLTRLPYDRGHDQPSKHLSSLPWYQYKVPGFSGLATCLLMMTPASLLVSKGLMVIGHAWSTCLPCQGFLASPLTSRYLSALPSHTCHLYPLSPARYTGHQQRPWRMGGCLLPPRLAPSQLVILLACGLVYVLRGCSRVKKRMTGRHPPRDIDTERKILGGGMTASVSKRSCFEYADI